uniref:Uncharacterized protein n=1 Tax=Rhizophora mucronata TaxID=61149 RepID=A0A2P2NX06_RHIMU
MIPALQTLRSSIAAIKS